MVDWSWKRGEGSGLYEYNRTDLSEEHEAKMGAAGDHETCQAD